MILPMKIMAATLTMMMLAPQEPFTYNGTNEPHESSNVTKMKDIPKTTWIWNAYNLNPAWLPDLKAQHVKKVYIQIEPELTINDYATFIKKAKKYNIDVYALAGEPSWATNRKEARAVMQWIEKAQKKTKLFAGVHLDIEPYALKSYSKKPQAILENYFDVLKAYRKMTNAQKMRLEADIPYWFDEELYDNQYGKGKVSDFVMRVTEEVAIMAYKQQASEIINITSHERAYAKKKGKAITIAVETHPSLSEPGISFATSTVKNFEQQVEAVYAKTKTPIGIHFLDSWRNLYNK